MFDNPELINTKIYRDLRGYFTEVYTSKNGYLNKYKFVQDNISSSKKGVIRGLHFQSKYPQTKFITVIKGKIFDVAVDLRNKSKNFEKVFSYNLSDKNNQLLIPRGSAHGFQCLSDYAIIIINVTIFIILMISMEFQLMMKLLKLNGQLKLKL